MADRVGVHPDVGLGLEVLQPGAEGGRVLAAFQHERVHEHHVTLLAGQLLEPPALLDEAGLPNCKITASNSLDEYLIRDLMMQGAQVDTFGVGERLITSKSNPVFGGVYKLAAIEDDEGNIIPKIKVSENTAKITNPHFKRLYRLYDRESGKAIADELTLRDEVIDPTKPHVIFDPNATWKTKELTDFTVRELQVPIFQNGELVYELPELNDIKAYCRQQIHTLWDEVKRFENPHTYYVDLSQKLWDVKRGLLEAAKC